MTGRVVCGAVLWLLRLVYLPVELLVAAAATGEYHLARDTVSDLGASGCSAVYCSPQHGLMNGAFVVTGLLLALGALLLIAQVGRVACGLLVLAGLSSVATGLAPVDGSATLHAVAAAPLFVCQPLALAFVARTLRARHAGLAVALSVTAVVTAAAAVGFVVADAGVGVLERVALWPVLLALAAVAVVVARPTPPRGGAGAGVRGDT